MIATAGHHGQHRQVELLEERHDSRSNRLEFQEYIARVYERLCGQVHVLIVDIEVNEEVLEIPRGSEDVRARLEQPVEILGSKDR